MNIKGCIALVTGANRGLGSAYTEALLTGGAAKVYAAARDPASIADARLTPIRLDVTSPADIAAAMKACQDIDLLINNAGAMLKSPMLAQGSEDAMRREMEVNVYGVLAMTRTFAPILARNGGGAVVNILSVVSWFVNPFIRSGDAKGLGPRRRSMVRLKRLWNDWRPNMYAITGITGKVGGEVARTLLKSTTQQLEITICL